jgi:hypothetical protein
MRNMMGNKFGSNEGIVNIGGTISSQNIGVGNNVTINAGPDQGDETLEMLLLRMAELLEKLPETMKQEKESVLEMKALLEKECKKANPNPITGKITAQGLFEASKTIGEVVPGLLNTAKAIMAFFC